MRKRERGERSAPFGTHYGDGFSSPSRGRNSWNGGELRGAVQLPLTRRRKLDFRVSERGYATLLVADADNFVHL